MVTPILPTLHVGSSELLESKRDICAYLIRFALTNPGRTSSQVEDELISFRKLEAEYGTDKTALADRFERKLNSTLARYFEGQRISVEVTASDISDLKYKLSITITDDGVPILDRGIVEVQNDTLIIKF